MDIATKYNPADVEGKWYEYWLKNGYFKSKPDGREPYTIVIPPPNVTGVLHMGHHAQQHDTGHSRAPRRMTGKMPAGYREPTMRRSLPKPKW